MLRDQQRGHPEGAKGPEGCPRGCQRSRGVPPRLIPTHEVGKPYKHEHGRKYWHYFLRMDNHPKGWLHLYEPSLGMICSYGKVMHFTFPSTPSLPSFGAIMQPAGRHNFLPCRKSGPNRGCSCVTQMGGRLTDSGAEMIGCFASFNLKRLALVNLIKSQLHFEARR